MNQVVPFGKFLTKIAGRKANGKYLDGVLRHPGCAYQLENFLRTMSEEEAKFRSVLGVDPSFTVTIGTFESIENLLGSLYFSKKRISEKADNMVRSNEFKLLKPGSPPLVYDFWKFNFNDFHRLTAGGSYSNIMLNELLNRLGFTSSPIEAAAAILLNYDSRLGSKDIPVLSDLSEEPKRGQVLSVRDGALDCVNFRNFPIRRTDLSGEFLVGRRSRSQV